MNFPTWKTASTIIPSLVSKYFNISVEAERDTVNVHFFEPAESWIHLVPIKYRVRFDYIVTEFLQRFASHCKLTDILQNYKGLPVNDMTLGKLTMEFNGAELMFQNENSGKSWKWELICVLLYGRSNILGDCVIHDGLTIDDMPKVAEVKPMPFGWEETKTNGVYRMRWKDK